MTYAVKFEHVTKRYPRGWSEDEGPRYPSLRHDVASIGKRLTRRGVRAKAHGTLALEDVSLEVGQGESFALIGPNGAGKSTALKMISRISYPTSGKVRIRGRVAALMEVGSGVHPELTGRENIWLYGQILGLKRAEIRRQFDEIVDFGELGHAIDHPVKFFSTGMQLRLGFSIAAHLGPDVFVVDEALAVGDARFQLRCVRKMRELVSAGHSLIFVSHDLSAVESICPRGALLEGGRVASSGPIGEVMHRYSQLNTLALGREIRGNVVRLTDVAWEASPGSRELLPGGPLTIRLAFATSEPLRGPAVSVGISDERPGNLVFSSTLDLSSAPEVVDGDFRVECRFASLPLRPHVYQVWVAVHAAEPPGDVLPWQPVGSLMVTATGMNDAVGGSPSFSGGGVETDAKWDWE